MNKTGKHKLAIIALQPPPRWNPHPDCFFVAVVDGLLVLLVEVKNKKVSITDRWEMEYSKKRLMTHYRVLSNPELCYIGFFYMAKLSRSVG